MTMNVLASTIVPANAKKSAQKETATQGAASEGSDFAAMMEAVPEQGAGVKAEALAVDKEGVAFEIAATDKDSAAMMESEQVPSATKALKNKANAKEEIKTASLQQDTVADGTFEGKVDADIKAPSARKTDSKKDKASTDTADKPDGAIATIMAQSAPVPVPLKTVATLPVASDGGMSAAVISQVVAGLPNLLKDKPENMAQSAPASASASGTTGAGSVSDASKPAILPGEATSLLSQLTKAMEPNAASAPTAVSMIAPALFVKQGKDSDTPVEATLEPSSSADGMGDREAPVAQINSPSAAVISNATATPSPYGISSLASASTVTPQVSNLGLSLGQQVVDMGVSGQWLDSISHQIASIAASNGQGSFQIAPANLGNIQVNITQGEHGAQVRMSVESDGAQMALQQDSERLIRDAQLASIRISDVRVDRVAAAGQSAASDMNSNQQNNNAQSQNQSAQSGSGSNSLQSSFGNNNGQNQRGNGLAASGQDLGGQGRGEGNARNQSKASGDAVVSRSDSRAGSSADGAQVRRARYA
jgi:flagellar hook-length control protein FliK